MSKKFILCFVLLFIVGCGSNLDSNDNSPSLEALCSADGNEFRLVLKKGQIVKYVDSVDGELGQETLDILNQEHLVGVSDNDEALRIMDIALKDLDGHCEKASVEE